MGKRKKGGFFGVSLGVGEPMNITVYALRVLNGVQVIAVPQSKKGEKSLALERIKKMPVHLEDKTVVELYMPMKRENLEHHWQESAKTIKGYLLKGLDVAFAGIGDLLQYGTFYYLENLLKREGFETLYIPGVSSYQLLASYLGLPLVQGEERMAVLADDEVTPDEIKAYDTIVFLKRPKNLSLFQSLSQDYTLFLGKNLGLKGESFGKIDDVERDLVKLPYFSLVIAKRGKW